LDRSLWAKALHLHRRFLHPLWCPPSNCLPVLVHVHRRSLPHRFRSHFCCQRGPTSRHRNRLSLPQRSSLQSLQHFLVPREHLRLLVHLRHLSSHPNQLVLAYPLCSTSPSLSHSIPPHLVRPRISSLARQPRSTRSRIAHP